MTKKLYKLIKQIIINNENNKVSNETAFERKHIA